MPRDVGEQMETTSVGGWVTSVTSRWTWLGLGAVGQQPMGELEQYLAGASHTSSVPLWRSQQVLHTRSCFQGTNTPRRKPSDPLCHGCAWFLGRSAQHHLLSGFLQWQLVSVLALPGLVRGLLIFYEALRPVLMLLVSSCLFLQQIPRTIFLHTLAGLCC